jgi:hypothetical protein
VQVPTQFTQFEATPSCGPPPLTVQISGRLVTGNGSVIPGEVGSVQVFINNQRGPSLASVNSTVNGVIVLASKGDYEIYAIFNGRGVWQSTRTEPVHVRVADDCLPVPMYAIVTIGMLVVVAVGLVYLAKSRKDSFGF